MLHWISENLSTLLIGGALLALLTAITASLLRQKKKGRSPCGCACSACPMQGACHHAPPTKKDPSPTAQDDKIPSSYPRRTPSLPPLHVILRSETTKDLTP